MNPKGTEPPIRVLTPRQYVQLLPTMRRNLSGWMVEGDAGWNRRLHNIDYLMCRSVGDTPFSHSNDPFENSYEPPRFASSQFGRQDTILVYMLQDAPVGIAIIARLRDVIEIDTLYTHVGQSHAGSVLVEHIVNHYCGAPPCPIRIYAMPAAYPFWRNCGFEIAWSPRAVSSSTPRHGSMTLRVATSYRWTHVEGKWRLAAYSHWPRYMI
ncbi:hypothetical protein ACFQU1_23015 [Chelatococcus sp. GCM10030263]|uniref:hypothetical protein n=1 Tax=Chelatococcus sp. GCM10030263 TaxID=3273387 RepID=UPI003610BC8E